MIGQLPAKAQPHLAAQVDIGSTRRPYPDNQPLHVSSASTGVWSLGRSQVRGSRSISAPMQRAFTASETSTRSMRRSEEHTSELQSLMRISYAVFCLKKKIHNINRRTPT